MMELLLLALFAFIVGIFVVSLGGGGSTLYLALLPVLFKIPPAEATYISITIIIPTTFFGSISHYCKGNVNISKAIPMLIFAIIGCIAGTLFSFQSPARLYYKPAGIALLILGLLMLTKSRKRILEGEEQSIAVFWINSILFGSVAGFVSGYFGLSGMVVTFIGLTAMGLNAIQIIGTSVFLLFGISTTSFLSHLVAIPDFNWPVLVALSIGAAGGGWLAPILLARLGKKMVALIIYPAIAILVMVAGALFLFSR